MIEAGQDGGADEHERRAEREPAAGSRPDEARLRGEPAGRIAGADQRARSPDRVGGHGRDRRRKRTALGGERNAAPRMGPAQGAQAKASTTPAAAWPARPAFGSRSLMTSAARPTKPRRRS